MNTSAVQLEQETSSLYSCWKGNQASKSYFLDAALFKAPMQIEQFVLTKPEDSWQAFEDMMNTSEEFYQSLKLIGGHGRYPRHLFREIQPPCGSMCCNRHTYFFC
jgi:hypothetical protein